MDDIDRVRESTSDEVNSRFDREIEENVKEYAGKTAEQISERITELEKEWDIERYIETNAPLLGLAGLTLGILYKRSWLILPAVVMSFLLQHAIQGWCPPVPVFRRLGIRTRKEIEREKYALKVLRGDFNNKDNESHAAEVLKAVAI